MERFLGNFIKFMSNGWKYFVLLKNVNFIESVFDIIESIFSIDDLSIKIFCLEYGNSLMIRNDVLEVNGKGDFDNLK